MTKEEEFWRKRAEHYEKRAEDYSKVCYDLIARMSEGLSFDSVTLNKDGITWTKEQPSPDRKKGKWIREPMGRYSTVWCSICGDMFFENDGNWKFCPHCGFPMEK